MNLLVRSKEEGDAWLPVTQGAYDNEDHLQRILLESPFLIPTQDLGGGQEALHLVVREVGLVGSGKTDLVGLDVKGNITIIETKLIKSPEIKRTVIGQILEYAAFLCGKSYEEFDTLIWNRRRKHITEFFEGNNDLPVQWDEEVFRKNVKRNLATGTFTLFVVVDDMRDDLRRVIEFLNQNMGIEIHALSLRYFRLPNNSEILMPQVFGSKPLIRTASLRSIQEWDEARLFEAATESLSPEDQEVFKRLYSFGQSIGEVQFGGGQDAAFMVRVVSPLGYLSLYQVQAGGKVNVYLKSLTKEGVDQGAVRSFIGRVKDLHQQVKIADSWQRSYGIIPFAVLRDQAVLEGLLEALRDLMKSW